MVVSEEEERVRNLILSSARCVWMLNAPGMSGVGMQVKDSSKEIASRVALRMPNLSQLRYLMGSGGHLVSIRMCISAPGTR